MILQIGLMVIGAVLSGFIGKLIAQNGRYIKQLADNMEEGHKLAEEGQKRTERLISETGKYIASLISRNEETLKYIASLAASEGEKTRELIREGLRQWYKK